MLPQQTTCTQVTHVCQSQWLSIMSIPDIRLFFLPGRQRQPGAVFQLCPVTQSHIMSRFDSWVAGARVHCPRKHSSSQPRGSIPGIEPGTLRLPSLAQQTFSPEINVVPRAPVCATPD